MGNKGVFRLSTSNLQRLEEVAKDELKEGAQPQRRSVFISFSFDDLNEVNLLRGQAKNENSDIEFIDRSLKESFNSENEEYIKRGIRERIRQSSVTVVYVTDNTVQSTWVDWEIRESIRLGKGVIALHKGDTPPRKLPSAIKEYGVKVIQWSQKNLSDAIERAAQERSLPQ